MTWEHIAAFFIGLSTWFCFVSFYQSKEIEKKNAKNGVIIMSWPEAFFYSVLAICITAIMLYMIRGI